MILVVSVFQNPRVRKEFKIDRGTFNMVEFELSQTQTRLDLYIIEFELVELIEWKLSSNSAQIRFDYFRIQTFN